MPEKTRRTMIFVLAAVICLSLAFAWTVSGQRSSSDGNSAKDAAEDQWEYLVVTGGNQNLSPISGEQLSSRRKLPDNSFREAFVLGRNFDKLGAQGWQLVAVHGMPAEPIYYFKRLKPRDAR
ncbi:MAG TPA: hypothetical protein PLD20_01280 [Blastocatellia bacterium]|nr:hypothetical protein [Blastocatellia bacterium]HMY72523.1 hypothetical protein [Blastocatellia bacterium]HMZ16568.1 hypothetical protein [Blastocatellia bacterium]HNG31650.1 hypothetical protein [Blastocatellia bacterium]